ncbi:hypothetical protein [Fluviicola sp.]|jgi:hypothetical protein|uniref:hypothetical protein n=1 Tax=Fluviicola sp. TaxID=1917219 RepID=UPI002825E778|nr:hypothetical protein [Fluviicola sp.]MDR0801770.1 hypothetical protein [Fluviicola sp.]
MINRFTSFVKANKRTFLVFLLSLISLFCFNVTKNGIGPEIFGWLRLWKYTSLLILFVCFYILLLKGKRVILANIALVALLILLLETILFFVLGMPSALKKDFSVPNLPENHIARQVGMTYYPDSVYHDIKINGTDTVFDVHYSIDHMNKRITPGFDSTKKNYALFFGCSIGFGYGLEDNQTLAYQVQKQGESINAYNFSISGTGTNHMLAEIKHRDLSKQVTEKDGCGYYIFFWDHLYRAIGTMTRYTEWLHLAPYYKMENRKLVRRKLFKDGRPFISDIYERLYQTNIVKYFEADLPLRLNDSHYDLVTEMVLETKKEYQKQFGNDKFYLVIYPNYMAYTPEQMQIFKSYLKKKKIKFIDLSQKIVYQGKYTLPGDAHPNAETNELMAKYLLQETKKL